MFSEINPVMNIPVKIGKNETQPRREYVQSSVITYA
jgi:hypothetical protein